MDRSPWRASLLRLFHQLSDHVDNAIIVDVEAHTAIRQAEVLAAKRMIERSIIASIFIRPPPWGQRLQLSRDAQLACLPAWHPATCAVFDKSTVRTAPWSPRLHLRSCRRRLLLPPGKLLTTTGSPINDGATLRYRASKSDCQTCRLKSRCCPKEPARSTAIDL